MGGILTSKDGVHVVDQPSGIVSHNNSDSLRREHVGPYSGSVSVLEAGQSPPAVLSTSSLSSTVGCVIEGNSIIG